MAEHQILDLSNDPSFISFLNHVDITDPVGPSYDTVLDIYADLVERGYPRA